ncbi:ParB/RepB/Spo0J family partition protein [Erythrobacter litoralis]|uniref:ParB/RepB/Spo0J family partition protein n=1 Tax=Erythrobacter litoralis TaxID=39960 RepID=UPI0024350566|nr:ParB/RepB/Spo0J family partition protein [Erythrobacter litoralis]MDG6079411.1 ParB/RepB/Spo0J family partition protein [Erythrobacter litoralis]
MTTIDRKRKLGKGLGALLGDVKREEPLASPSTQRREQDGLAGTARDTLQNIPTADISPLPNQPRTYFDDAALDELAASISARGVIQPIIVRPKEDGRYELVAGERRWRAAQRARLHAIPAIVRNLNERDVTALALIENLQREDLNPIEEARAYQRLSDDQGMTQAEIAKLVDKSRSHVANFQRLLSLPESVLSLVADAKLSMGHARALIGKSDADRIAKEAVDKNLSVREVEHLSRIKQPTKGRKTDVTNRDGHAGNEADIAAVQGHLEEFLGMPVKISITKSPNTGNVTIGFRTLDQLDLICQRLTGGEI